MNKKKHKTKKQKYQNGLDNMPNAQLYKEILYYLKFLHLVPWQNLNPEHSRDSICKLISRQEL